jgi:hypothetical protein
VKRSYLPILIVLAFFLSSASPSPKPSVIPTPRISANNPSKSSDQGRRIPEPAKTPTTETNQNKTANVANKHEADAIKVIVPPVIVQKDWTDYGFVIFSGLLVVVAGLQLFLLKQALKADRPYIWVRRVEGLKDPPSVTMEVFRDVITHASCFIQNLGKGPAVNIQVIARMKFGAPPLFYPGMFADCQPQHSMLQPVVTESEPTNFIVRLSTGISDRDVTEMYDSNSPKRITCYGIVRYEDVFGNRYKTSFGYHRQQFVADNTDGFVWQFVRGPSEYNHHT